MLLDISVLGGQMNWWSDSQVNGKGYLMWEGQAFSGLYFL